jgi:Radical SAM proteins, N-terminal/Radical SAM superfamily
MSRSPEAIGRWLDAHLGTFDGPEQYLGDEPNTLLAEYRGDRARLWDERSACRWLLAASWPYDQAAGNMALPAIYNAIREAGPYLADRWYQPLAPRDWDTLVRAKVPVFGIETRHQLADYDVAATSVSYPVLFQNFSAYLMASGVPLRRRDRAGREGDYPLLMVGGLAYSAPEFMTAVFDCVWCGEIEDAEGQDGGIGEVCEAIAGFKADGSWVRDRVGCYCALARRFNHLYFPAFTEFSYEYQDRGLLHPTKMVSGYRPVLEGMAHPHRKRFVRNLDAARPLLRAPLLYRDPGMGAGDVEQSRGCGCWCVMCKASWDTKPYREHSPGYLIAQALQWRKNMGATDVTLVGLDPPMYGQRRELVGRLLAEVTGKVDMSSGRVDDFNAGDFALLLGVTGTDSVSLGLEGNSPRLRDAAGKGTSDEDVCALVTRAIRAGIKRIKLYMITNWPGEDEHDVMRIVELGKRLASIRDGFGDAGRRTRIQMSWTPLMIEPQTPLQWFAATVPDYRLQKAMDELRGYGIHVRIGSKANQGKMSFFQLCQRASREAGEAIADVIEAIGAPSWGGFPDDIRERLDAALVEHGFRNGLEDLFGERFYGDLLGWEHIDTGVKKSLLWRAYTDMVRFLERTDSRTYGADEDGPASGNEWVRRCDEACAGNACGTCSREDLELRRDYIKAGKADRQLPEAPAVLVDRVTEASRLRLRLTRPAEHRFISALSGHFTIRAAVNRACEATGFPGIADRSVRLASDATAYRDRSTGVEYAEFAVTRPVRAGKLLTSFLSALAVELWPWLVLEACEVLAPSAKLPARPVGLWELETDLSEEELAVALRRWDQQDHVRVQLKSDSFYAGPQADWVNAKDHVADVWAARDGQRTVLRMLLPGRLGPYQAAQALLSKTSWLPLAVFPARRLGFFRPGQEAGVLSCAGCGGVIPEGLLGELFDSDYCPRCRDAAAGQIIAGLDHVGVLQGTGFCTGVEEAVDNHLYASVAQLRAEVDDDAADPHRKAAAAVFGCDLVLVTKPERQWGKFLNMAALTGLSEWGLADLAQAPMETVRDMLARYHQLVLA